MGLWKSEEPTMGYAARDLSNVKKMTVKTIFVLIGVTVCVLMCAFVLVEQWLIKPYHVQRDDASLDSRLAPLTDFDTPNVWYCKATNTVLRLPQQAPMTLNVGEQLAWWINCDTETFNTSIKHTNGNRKMKLDQECKEKNLNCSIEGVAQFNLTLLRKIAFYKQNPEIAPFTSWECNSSSCVYIPFQKHKRVTRAAEKRPSSLITRTSKMCYRPAH